MKSMVQQNEPDPGTDILQAVRILGGEVDSFEETTRLATGRRRACFRLKLKDGRTVKGRRFASEEMRESFTALYPALDGLPFSRLLACFGFATVEEWVPGTQVHAEYLDSQQMDGLATVLGRLNCRPIPHAASTARIRGVSWHANRLRNLLSELVADGYMESDYAARTLNLALDDMPPDFECGVIHTDYHPGNMILKQQNEIWTIDNEGLRIGVLDYDLARSWRQWPMTPQQRETFLKAYGRFRRPDSFLAHQRFWSISTLVMTARINSRHQRPIQGFLETLDQNLQDESDAFWPQQLSGD